MSDWDMYVLEDIVWDEFGDCDDHIVPHPAGKQGNECAVQGDFHKNSKHEAITAVGKSADCKFAAKYVIQGKEETDFLTLKYWNAPKLETTSRFQTPDGVFPDLGDSDHIKEVTNLASDDANLLSNCFESRITDEFCEDDAILGNKGASVERNLCHFALGNISPSDSDLKFFGTEHEDKESSDLLYNGWPYLGNFEDVDNIFRTCDSTFRQGNASNDGELSWFSSPSRAFNGSEDVLKSGINSSCSESSALKSHCQADIKFMSDSANALIIGSDKKNVPSIYTTSSQTLDAYESATLGHASYGNWLDSTVEDKQESLSKEQEHEINGGLEVKISPVTHTSNENSRMENLVVQAAFTDRIPVQKQLHQILNEIGGHSKVGVSIELPAEADSSTVQERSCMSSELSDEISLEATSFRQLHHVVEQLDMRTKLCIRDSLCRLARNAEQRLTFGNLNCNRRGRSGLLTTEESDNCMGFMDIETDTNPIDRSIAHLLFHTPLDPSTRLANDASFSETCSTIHGPITSQPAILEKLVLQEETAG